MSKKTRSQLKYKPPFRVNSAAEAQTWIGRDTETALLLARESVSRADTTEARTALRAALLEPYVDVTLAALSYADSASFSEDGKWVLTTRAAGANIWSAQDGTLLQHFPQHGNVLNAILSPDGNTLIVSTSPPEGVIHIWDVRTGVRRFFQLEADHGARHIIAVTPDWHQLIVARDKQLQVWDLQAEKLIWQGLLNHEAEGIRVSDDGKLFVTFGNDPVPQVWETSSGKLVSQASWPHRANPRCRLPSGRSYVGHRRRRRDGVPLECGLGQPGNGFASPFARYASRLRHEYVLHRKPRWDRANLGTTVLL